MRRSRFLHIRAMLLTAEELYDAGEINDEIYLRLIETIESDYNSIVKQMEHEELGDILNKYIIGFS